MAGSTIAQLGAIAAEQWGIVTTAQATEVGVSRKTLSSLTATGALERLAQGVYRMAGAPAAMLESNSGLRSRAATDSARLTGHYHRRAGAADRVHVAHDVALEHRAADS
ncbi:type IV toxin-antitoxin system AbiEi family antitoxin domain-containing protein [Microbacterium sp. GXS0129]|uniref:type IV toxin-antitoxin system AbiEi family antitoxin domain-containing protein n=1 Tax=Microbacterium sp. GXS0129 TaxID=3377836 RepID=UPI00383B8E15